MIMRILFVAACLAVWASRVSAQTAAKSESAATATALCERWLHDKAFTFLFHVTERQFGPDDKQVFEELSDVRLTYQPDSGHLVVEKMYTNPAGPLDSKYFFFRWNGAATVTGSSNRWPEKQRLALENAGVPQLEDVLIKAQKMPCGEEDLVKDASGFQFAGQEIRKAVRDIVNAPGVRTSLSDKDSVAQLSIVHGGSEIILDAASGWVVETSMSTQPDQFAKFVSIKRSPTGLPLSIHVRLAGLSGEVAAIDTLYALDVESSQVIDKEAFQAILSHPLPPKAHVQSPRR